MSRAAMKPTADEHAPYYSRYVSLVPDGEIVEILSRQLEETLALLRSISEERAGESYEPGKWTVKELVGHMIDAERIFAYRALRIARGDRTPLAGFEQDDYVRNGNFAGYTLEALARELELVRRANVLMFEHLAEEAWSRRGTASDAEVSVRAIAYILAGHELHHQAILVERYFSAAVTS